MGFSPGSSHDTDSAAIDCGSTWQWIDQQNAMAGFPTAAYGGSGGGGGCGNCGGGGVGGGGVVKPKPHKAQKPAPVCTKQHHPKGCRKPKPGIKA